MSSPQYRNYRFWPVYVLALLKTFYFSLYDLALPNYLIFDKGLKPSIVGVIISSYSIAYIMGPLLGEKITEKLGIRVSVIASTMISSFVLIFQLFFPIPGVLIPLRFLDGIALGLFWPNLQLEMCNWEHNSDSHTLDSYFKTYGTSWNVGLLLGYLFGYLIVFFLKDDFFALTISVFVCIASLPCSFFLEKASTKLRFVENQPVVLLSGHLPTTATTSYLQSNSLLTKSASQSISESTPISTAGRRKPDLNDENSRLREKTVLKNPFLKYPARLCMLMVFCFSLSTGVFNFNIPFIVEMRGKESFWVYILNFAVKGFQIATIRIVSNFNYKKTFRATFIVLGALFLASLWMFFAPPFALFFTIYLLTGAVFGLMYSFFTKVMLAHTSKTKSSRFANLYEVFMGAGFGFSPFLGGFIAEHSLYYNYFVVMAIVVVVLAANWHLFSSKK